MDEKRARIRRVLESWLETEDGRVIEKFYTRLRAESLSDTRILKYLYVLRVIRRIAGKPFEKLTKEDVERIIAKINESNSAKWTKATNLRIFMRFLRFLEEVTGKELVIDVKIKEPRNELKPEDLLTPEEFRKLFSACPTVQDRLMMGLLYETGMRAGELLSMRVGSIISVSEKGVKFVVRGKTGERVLMSVWYAGLFQDYLENHPAKDDPSAPLFYVIKDSRLEPLQYAAFRKRLKKIARTAGIRKRVYPHIFRHTRMTELAKSLPENVLKEWAGWSRTSKMPAVYVHLSQRDVESVVLSRVYGIETERSENNGYVVCRRCGTVNPPHAKHCFRCGLPFEESAAARELERERVIEKLDRVLFRFLMIVGERFPDLKEELMRLADEEGLTRLLVREVAVKGRT